ncbi:sugar nucleotide-binding protein [Flagellimonas allohymeniacidonis]|uniref:dTDP-4-dehydrorhamnose reductase n=1 Tax=Flagellimonas allohymeniacidonis TaxID=2517819 RepID=A0A4Q8QIR8_9FLAO|nr:sugar nucleotide-binding protein [Allomuricauda hymeniacidonis]TAI48329.1 NAD-dependent epimerase/dehydratase family protein [Allomuricauda hymeniacidonis]
MKKKRILILGASGFIGNAIYKELCSYFDTYGTYCSNTLFQDNRQFYRYDLQEDDIFRILERVKPHFIISALRGSFGAQIQAHQHIIEYLLKNPCKLYFISSANVFDAYSKFPSYEMDKTLSESIYGRLKIKIENMLMRIPKKKMAILRVPMVFGNTSPRIKEIRLLLENNDPIEVFPNLIINVTNDDRLTQQIHYLINRDKYGIFHLGSEDLIQHEEFIKEIIRKMGNYHPILKRVYTTNEDRYLAALPKDHLLPKNLRISYQEIIDHHLTVE